MFAWDRFIWEHDAHCAAEIDVDVAAVETLHDAAHDLALFVREFFLDGCALRLPYVLQNHLFRGLRRDPAETLVKFEHELEFLARLGVRFYFSRFLEENVAVWIVSREQFLLICGRFHGGGFRFFHVLFLLGLLRFLFYDANLARLNHGFYLEEFHLSSFHVELRADYFRAFPVFLFVCGGNRCLDRSEHFFRRYPFLARDLLNSRSQ